MSVRFWQPEGEPPGEELYLVGAMASENRLYILLEGPAPSPPQSKDDTTGFDPMLVVRVVSGSGDAEICGSSGSFGKAGRPRTLLADMPAPVNPADPLTVQLLREDGSVVWETRAVPAPNP